MITPGQLRAARVLLGWRQNDLAKKAGVGTGTVNRAEKGEKLPRPFTMKLLEDTLRQAGVKFVPADGEVGPGVVIESAVIGVPADDNPP